MPNKKLDYSNHLKYYQSQHKTLGCKITHLFGIPLIFISIPMLFLDWRKSLALFSLGWILQFIGHFVFEKNSPVLFSKKAHPLTIFSALFYATDNWLYTLKAVLNVLANKDKNENVNNN